MGKWSLMGRFFLACDEELRRPQADKSSAEDTSGEAARKSFSKKIFAWVTF